MTFDAWDRSLVRRTHEAEVEFAQLDLERQPAAIAEAERLIEQANDELARLQFGVVAVDAPFGPGEPIGIGSLNSSISIRPPLSWSWGSGQNLGLVSMAPGRVDSTSSSSHVPMCVGLSAVGPRSTPRESDSHHGLINEFEIWLQVGSDS